MTPRRPWHAALVMLMARRVCLGCGDELRETRGGRLRCGHCGFASAWRVVDGRGRVAAVADYEAAELLDPALVALAAAFQSMTAVERRRSGAKALRASPAAVAAAHRALQAARAALAQGEATRAAAAPVTAGGA